MNIQPDWSECALKIKSKLRMRDLDFLVAVGTTGSLSMAATSLSVTQPAASRWLMELEQLFGVHLFHRNGVKGMMATEAGELVIAGARAMLADLVNLSDDVFAMKAGVGGAIRLGVVNLVSSKLVTRLVSILEGPEYNISVSLTESDTTSLINALKHEVLDAVFGRYNSEIVEPPLAGIPLFGQQACLVTSKYSSFYKADQADLSVLRGCKWILPHSNTPLRRAINTGFTSAGLNIPRGRLETDSQKLIHALLISTNDMVAIVPEEVGAELEGLGGVGVRPVPIKIVLPPIGIVYHQRHIDRQQLKVLISTIRKLVSSAPSLGVKVRTLQN